MDAAPPQSVLPGIEWPAVVHAHGASALAVLFQMERSQWWTPERIQRRQLQQLQEVVRHAWSHVPFYRRRLQAAGLHCDQPFSARDWTRMPVLTRRDLQERRPDAREVPASHRPTVELKTSGSTGEPVTVLGTALTSFYWRVFTLRDHLWHRRDLGGRLASIRAIGRAFEPQVSEHWGPATAGLYRTGAAGLLGIATDVSAQVGWLLDFDPDYLLTHPSNLIALADEFERRGRRLARLREVRTVGETLTEAAVRACAQGFRVPLVDAYSSQEIGYLALQCPDQPDGYHVQSESVMVEILDEDGEACPPGRAGRVVVSTLHNFATPLLRYDTRDYAEPGLPCGCGRGLPVIRRILGRERNMLVMPSGERRWPMTGFMQYESIAPVRQYQFVQHDRERIEVRITAARPLAGAEENALREHIQRSLGYPFRIDFVYMESIPRSSGGKFEDFVSHAT